MKLDILKQFIAVKAALEQERLNLQAKLVEIEAALASFGALRSPGKRGPGSPTKADEVVSLVVAQEGSVKPTGTKYKLSPEGRARLIAAQKARWAKIKGAEVSAAPEAPKRGPGSPKSTKNKVSAAGRLQNPISLPKAVVQVTSKKPMTRQEVLEAVLKLGYRFQTKEPMKSLNPILYGKNPKFDRVGGKFSAPKSAGVKAPVTKTPAPAPVAQKPKRKLSAAGRAAIIAATKARWAKVKAKKK